MKGKHWGSLTAPVAEGYRQVKHGSHGGSPGGKYVAVSRSKEYATNVKGSHGGKVKGKFLGHTKGNRDLPIDRSTGTGGGNGGGQHKAGGK